MASSTMLLYAVVGNIPHCYHSSDLRNFFSRFIEKDGFHCFHFRHRPEGREKETKLESASDDNTPENKHEEGTHGISSKKNPKVTGTCCCVICLRESQYRDFVQMYDCRHWITETGESMKRVCHIIKIKTSSKSTDDHMEPQYRTRLEQSLVSPDREEFYEEDLKSLIELNPPTVMPKGNVGTPTLVFLDLIRRCLLPPKIISKLKLKFSKAALDKKYGNVPFDYEVYDQPEWDQENASVCWLPVTSGSGHELLLEERAAREDEPEETIDSLNGEEKDVRGRIVGVVGDCHVSAQQRMLGSLIIGDSGQTVGDRKVEEKGRRNQEGEEEVELVKGRGGINPEEEEGVGLLEERGGINPEEEEGVGLLEERGRINPEEEVELVEGRGRRNPEEVAVELVRGRRNPEGAEVELVEGRGRRNPEEVAVELVRGRRNPEGAEVELVKGRGEMEEEEASDNEELDEEENRRSSHQRKGTKVVGVDQEEKRVQCEESGSQREGMDGEMEHIERENGSSERVRDTGYTKEEWSRTEKYKISQENIRLFKEGIRQGQQSVIPKIRETLEENVGIFDNKNPDDDEWKQKKQREIEKQKAKLIKKQEIAARRKKMALRIEEKMIEFERGSDHSEDDADECEEWERHEALHDDPSNQERNEERLFEQEIELKWEKGGSGLVFYTDAQFWKQQEGDFDEQTADDWDVDISGYYERGSGDMDGRDLIRIRRDQRRRECIDDEDGMVAGIGKFEKHTKGFGRKIMERHGWKDGEGLGSSTTGIAEALKNDGQNPHCKMGFGFQEPKRGKRADCFYKRQDLKEWHGPIISTVYDDPSVTDPADPLLRRNEPYQLKRRKNNVS